MVQILRRPASTGERFANAFGGAANAASQLIPEHMLKRQQEADELDAGKRQGLNLKGMSPETRQEAFKQAFKSKGDLAELEKKDELRRKLLADIDKSPLSQNMTPDQKEQVADSLMEGIDLSDEGSAEKRRSRDAQEEDPFDKARKYAAIGEHDLTKVATDEAKFKSKKANEERAYHTGFSKEQEQKANELREALPKKEFALDFARNAIETGDVSFFSPDKLADITGIDLFRTAKGAQLVTAGKENLLSNMSRASAKAQNLWFEQRLNSMFPKIGQDREANLTVQEMLEGELAMDKAYLDQFDKLADQDQKTYGFVKKDIAKRARDSVKPIEKEILKRTTYRMKELEEGEKGLQTVKKEVGKNVVKGTPLTLSMAKLYKDKFGESALKVAEKNGYYIPTLEEFKIFQQTPQEFRE